ncbi:MAG: hypothetical protein GXP30_12370 [Verrucomicrobia bacterium]|nr:hypothetical protein [Verrucomicrobiota bacterium]
MGTRIKNRNAAGILCVQIVVIGFWAATTSVLVKRTWFSDESRMAEVPPEKILGMFFAWTEGVDLTILKEGQRIGQMSLSTQEKKRGVGKNEDEQGSLREISMSGSLDRFSPTGEDAEKSTSVREKEFHWRGMLAVTDELNFTKGDFVLRMPKLGLGAQVGFDHKAETILLNVRSGSKVLIDYRGKPTGLKELPELGWLGSLLPLESLLGGKGVSEGMMKAWAPEISGRYGSALVAGRRMMVYQLVIRGANSGGKPGSEVKLYLSETGEPLMLDTAWGYQALAAILVPVEGDEGSRVTDL